MTVCYKAPNKKTELIFMPCFSFFIFHVKSKVNEILLSDKVVVKFLCPPG